MAYPHGCRHELLIPAEAMALPHEGAVPPCTSASSASATLLRSYSIGGCAVLTGMHDDYVALADV